MKRSVKDYLLISLKGMSMGAVEPLPGISGGTVAFVTGVYEEFLNTIKGAFPALKELLGGKPFRQRVTDFWTAANGAFIVALGSGMVVAAVAVATVAKQMQDRHPVLFYGFIFGLVAASAVLVYKKVGVWTWPCYALGAAGIGLALLLPVKPLATGELVPLWYLFICACVAACAFLLPGTSGSFFLLLSGAYYTFTSAVAEFNIPQLAVLGAGVLTGMVAFSNFLSWLLKNHHDKTVAFMTGFIVGSLKIIWPWKAEIAQRTVNAPPDSATLPGALAACLIGIVFVLGIECAANALAKKKKAA
jgi:putative membrane protein